MYKDSHIRLIGSGVMQNSLKQSRLDIKIKGKKESLIFEKGGQLTLENAPRHPLLALRASFCA